MKLFQKAVPVWGADLTYPYNQILGFRTDVEVIRGSRMRIALAARTYYRLYVNGLIVGNGPARTARGYCRVDEYEIPAKGLMRLAVEVIALDKPEKYSNDNTMEPGLLTMEVAVASSGEEWQVAAATGDGSFGYLELLYRSSMAELMSHSRGIVEHYRLGAESFAWLTGSIDGLRKPEPLTTAVQYLERRAPYPDYHRIPVQNLMKVRDVAPGPKMAGGILFTLSKMFNPDWYELLAAKDQFLEALLAEKEALFTGRYERIQWRDYGETLSGALNGRKGMVIDKIAGAAAVIFSLPKVELGFIHFMIETEAEAIVDLINADQLDAGGMIPANTYAVRYQLEKGCYDLTTFEPKLTRYIKLVIRTGGKVTLSDPELWDYSYPDANHSFFECSDGELNLIYEGARRTLRLNTLDIFMDCPQRERGGWLCDSQFTAWAAWQLFGDLRVEKDFIENFMLTDPGEYEGCFFPEVYPGVNERKRPGKRKQAAEDADKQRQAIITKKSPGIESWSFWLLTQLWDYYRRSGDQELIRQCFGRVEAFLDAAATHIGTSGLFEGFENLFVDWSLSNGKFALYPISLPVNCLIAHAYQLMSELYQVERWAEVAVKVSAGVAAMKPEFGLGSDGYTYENDRFTGNGCLTEAGVALRLWSGFGQDEPAFVRSFVEAMGTRPEKRPNPNIGRANLFIGLMIRFDVLAQLGKIDVLVRELKDVYLPQLLHGPGTFFENIDELSGCHGFNGMAGALLVNQVLGLGQPRQLTRTVRISPHPGNLTWACGNAVCEDGVLNLEWAADHELHILDMKLDLPDGWDAEVELPFELSGWEVKLNGTVVRNVKDNEIS